MLFKFNIRINDYQNYLIRVKIDKQLFFTFMQDKLCLFNISELIRISTMHDEVIHHVNDN